MGQSKKTSLGTSSSAHERFMELEAGIFTLVKAADILTLHLLELHRMNQFPEEMYKSILLENNISGFTLTSESYGVNELSVVDKSGKLRQLGEQIILATYTALEVYLIEKFKEYYRHRMRPQTGRLVEVSLLQFSFRSLKEIKTHYFEVLRIHLPSFDCQYFSDPQSSFQPKDSWEAITLIAKVRNEIAHEGKAKSYQVSTPMDSWFPFEFAQRWVAHFDTNFDMYVYENREPGLIRDYQSRLDKISEADR